MNRIKEPARELPAQAACDVLVAGGGVAGIAAALAAARSGADVLLVEKQCVLGGLATSGLVTIYLPLCDGRGCQMSYGIAEELFRLSVVHGAQDRYPSAWLAGNDREARAKQRFEVQFNPVYFMLETERLLLEEGVRILYDTRICDVHTQNGRLDAVVVENRDGRSAVRCKAAVDASGEALLFREAGEATRPHGRGNLLSGWYYASTPGGLKLTMLGFADAAPESERDSARPLSDRRFSGDSAADICDFLTRSHAATLAHVLEKAGEDGRIEPAEMPHMPQYRMTRCLCGAVRLTEAQNGAAAECSVGMIGDWRKRGPRFEIPFGALYGDRFENVFAAGRCISVDDGTWDVIRAIPACAVTGQAAGTAAALAPEKGRVSGALLQRRLREAGQRLTFGEAG